MKKMLLKKIYRKFWNVLNKHKVVCEFGPGCSFGVGCSVDSRSSVGCYTSINSYSIVTKAQIGNYCSIGNFVTIGPGEHDLTQISTSSLFYENSYKNLTKKDCKIGNDVWIGNFAFIRRGVLIGHGAVIGAHSVVLQDVPQFSVVVGVPSKIIRKRFDKKMQEKIIESGWWNTNIVEAEKKIKLLQGLI